MAKKPKDWIKLSAEEKLEALREDVNLALDLSEPVKEDQAKIRRSIDQINYVLKTLAGDIFEIKKQLGMK
jgi:hypothetical protein